MARCRRFALLAGLGLLLGLAPVGAADDGEAIYTVHCAICHGGQLERAPGPEQLGALPAESIVETLTSGSMQAVGAGLTPSERQAVARFLARSEAGPGQKQAAVDNTCADAGAASPASLSDSPSWNGWGVDTANTRYQPASAARLPVRDVRRLELAWAFGYPGEILAYAHPAVAGGRLYVGSQIANVYSLDARSGCEYWVFKARAGVRTGIVLGEIASDGGSAAAAFFGDQSGWLYALDALSGAERWSVRLDEHPYAQIVGSPVLHAGILYVPMSSFEEVAAADPGYRCCTFRGSIAAVDAASGEILWQSRTIDAAPGEAALSRTGRRLLGPSGAAIWAAPTIDTARNLVYVVTGDNYSEPATPTSDAVMAFDLDSGERRWVWQALTDDLFNVSCIMPDPANCPRNPGPDLDLGAAPLLLTLMNGKRRLYAGQKSGMLYALDADRDGQLAWSLRTSAGGARGGIQWGIATDGHQIFVPVSDWAAIEYQPEPGSAASDLPGFGREGGLRAIDADTGEPLWYAPPAACDLRDFCSPAHSAPVTAIPGAVFAATLDGRIRAYSSIDGEVLWEYDSLTEFDTINGVAARGGAIDGTGPVVVDGMLFVNSGYGRWSSPPGNVLLAFAPAPDAASDPDNHMNRPPRGQMETP